MFKVDWLARTKKGKRKKRRGRRRREEEIMWVKTEREGRARSGGIGVAAVVGGALLVRG